MGDDSGTGSRTAKKPRGWDGKWEGRSFFSESACCVRNSGLGGGKGQGSEQESDSDIPGETIAVSNGGFYRESGRQKCLTGMALNNRTVVWFYK